MKERGRNLIETKDWFNCRLRSFEKRIVTSRRKLGIATEPRFISKNKIISFSPSPQNRDDYEAKGWETLIRKESVDGYSEEPSLPESHGGAVPRRQRERGVSVLRCRVAPRYSREPRDQPCRVSRVCPAARAQTSVHEHKYTDGAENGGISARRSRPPST